MYETILSQTPPPKMQRYAKVKMMSKCKLGYIMEQITVPFVALPLHPPLQFLIYSEYPISSCVSIATELRILLTIPVVNVGQSGLSVGVAHRSSP